MRNLKLAALLAGIVLLSLFAGCSTAGNQTEDAVSILLSDDGINVESEAKDHGVVAKNDIIYYPEGKDFTFGEGTDEDAHTREEADQHTVVHITKPGTYELSGKLSYGQIAVDLGEDAKEDETAKVTLVLNGVDINCDVAPAVIFYNVYECDSSEEETAKRDVDTSEAGANVIIADGTENYIEGSYVAKIYESIELSEDGTQVEDSEKLHKYDGAFYSKMSMNIFGQEENDGVLKIKADNEGLDSELHLTINGGNIEIESGNDGINTNEDNVSVTTINGGTVRILVNGATGEGDGIDSNGWLVINGGTLDVAGCGFSEDAGIDADLGIHINGGEVIASGNMLDRISESNATYVVFEFAEKQAANQTYTLKNEAGETIKQWTAANDFSILVVSSQDITEGAYTLWRGEVQLVGMIRENEMPGGFGDGDQPPQRDDMPPRGAPQGEPPEMPNGEMPPRGGFSQAVPAEMLTETFTIKAGGNHIGFITENAE